MGVFYQANAGSQYILGNGDRAGDGLIAGLGVIALVRDRADDVDATRADQVGSSALGQSGVEVMGDAVVLDHRAVGIGTTVQAAAITVGRYVVAEYASQDDAVGELAGGAEQDHLFVDGGRVPIPVGTGAQCEPWQPGGGQFSGFYLHARGLHLHGGDDAEADEVFEQAGEGGEVVHGADGGVACV